MNENIKALLNQAELDVLGGMIVDAVSGFEGITAEQLEKFTEMIVRECIDYCGEKLSKQYIENHAEKEQVLLLASIADYSNEIRKHFGVEP